MSSAGRAGKAARTCHGHVDINLAAVDLPLSTEQRI